MQNNQQQQLPCVSLLVAVMLLFGVVWSHDSGMSRNGDAAKRWPTEDATNFDAVADFLDDRTNADDSVEVFHATDYAVPLPDGLTSGRYRIVNDRGYSTIDKLTFEELTKKAGEKNLAPRNFYEVEQNGIRWYYIRLDSSKNESEESRISSFVPLQPLVAPKPRSYFALPQVLTSSFATVLSSISTGFRRAADGIKTTANRIVQTPRWILERLNQAKRKAEADRFPNMNHDTAPGIDTEELLDSVFY